MTQTYLSESLFFMQEMGLEPTRGRPRQILSLMRLPFRHSCESYYLTGIYVTTSRSDLQAFYFVRQSNSSKQSNVAK